MIALLKKGGWYECSNCGKECKITMKERPKTGIEGRYGRPLLLTQELVNNAKEYLKTAIDEVKFGESGEVISWGVNLPKIEGLALYLGVSRAQLYEWLKENENDDETRKELRQQYTDIYE